MGRDSLIPVKKDELGINFIYNKVGMFISKDHWDLVKKSDATDTRSVPRPIFAQFTNCRFAEQVIRKIINLTSKALINIYIHHVFSAESMKMRNEALKHRKELLQMGPHSSIKLDFPGNLKSKPKSSKGRWKT